MTSQWTIDMFDPSAVDSASGDAGDYSPASGPYIPEPAECARCGLCVSVCPTFQLFRTDDETPRSRVRTLGKLLGDRQAISDDERRHLDNCLQCRACETLCPSRMAYGELFDRAQALLQPTRPRNRLADWGFRLVARKRIREALMPMLALYLKSGLRQLVRRSGLLARLNLSHVDALLSMPTLTRLSGIHAVKGRKYRGRVALFTGCLAEPFDAATQQAALKLLRAFGYEVVVPEQQGCCGAIHRHNGRDAQALIDKNIETFYALEVSDVLYTASGCGAMLADYQSDDEEKAGWFRRHVRDINDFLLANWPTNLTLAASNLNVAVHEPCSQRNGRKQTEAVYTLLRKIPGVEVWPLPENQFCCGAGGSYLLSHPEIAGSLKQRKREAMVASGADLVVSGNFGCAFHLNANGSDPAWRVVHPIQLLADRL